MTLTSNQSIFQVTQAFECFVIVELLFVEPRVELRLLPVTLMMSQNLSASPHHAVSPQLLGVIRAFLFLRLQLAW